MRLLVLKKGEKKKVMEHKRKLVTKNDPKSPISEQYRTIRTNIQFSSVDEEIRTIMVTSSGPGEGKSTTTANLAVVSYDKARKCSSSMLIYESQQCIIRLT